MTSPNFRPNDTEWRVMHDMNKRLTAIEERLSKLEGSAVKVEYSVNNGLAIPTGSPLAALGDPNPPMTEADMLRQGPKQSPKVCPVSGMFLEEPDYEEYFNVENGVAGSEGRYRPISRGNFVTGNCFATREDAERYAKHLKAMAKLRRLGGVIPNGMVMKFDSTIEYRNVWAKDMYNQLTPEEQNALMWPNEEM